MSESGAVAGGVRVSDAERERVARRLAEAHSEGRLTLAEFDERVGAAHAAVVRADLDPLLGDLPAPAVERSTRPSRPRPVRMAGPCSALGLRGSAAAWAVVSLVNLVIWVAVVAGAGHLVYPWWVWVAGPWGLVLLARLAARGARPGALQGR